MAFSIASKESKGTSDNRSMQPWTFSTINLYGIDNKTGEVVLFIRVNNRTDAMVVNATAIDLIDGKPKNNIMEASFMPFPHLLAKTGDRYRACAMVLKNLDFVCYIGHFSPTNGSQNINILLNSYKEK